MAHFSKFVPVGSHAVNFDISVADITAEKSWWTDTVDDVEYDHYEVRNNMNVSAFKTPDGSYVAVIVNDGIEKQFTYSMLGYNMSVYTTDVDRNLELTDEGSGIETVKVPENSIVTVVFEPMF